MNDFDHGTNIQGTIFVSESLPYDFNTRIHCVLNVPCAGLMNLR